MKRAVLALSLALAGCSWAYYSAWEAVGKDKRDLLRDNVEAVRDRQQDAKEQVEDALERLRALYGAGGGDLEKHYDRVRSSYDASVERSEALKGRIERVEKVGADLFREWASELEEIQDRRLRRDSQRKLDETRRRFETLRRAMRQAEASLEPVMIKLKDHVLYLKHNLNAQAIGHLQGEVGDIERSYRDLVREMNRSIQEAERFVQAIPTS